VVESAAMSATLPFFAAPEIHAALPFPRLIEALRAAFAAGGVSVPLRHVHTVRRSDGARLLLMPAWREGEAIGVKLVSVFPGNRDFDRRTVAALYVLLDGASGHPRALLDGEALTLRRTAAASALASSFLSRPDSATLLVVGAGALAPYMALAHCAARKIERVLVWGRDAARAQALAVRLRADGLPAETAADLDLALNRADIVTCATTAREPVLRGARVRPGTHVDLAGGFTPEMREADDDLIARAAIFVDTYAGALAEAGDLVQPMAHGSFARERVRAELAELCSGRKPGRLGADEITVFKSVGTALEDLCAASLVVATPLEAASGG
jgi:ornithine cyclodeaminase/alanine dehydrogenase-like protein (mu-crystallin family)